MIRPHYPFFSRELHQLSWFPYIKSALASLTKRHDRIAATIAQRLARDLIWPFHFLQVVLPGKRLFERFHNRMAKIFGPSKMAYLRR